MSVFYNKVERGNPSKTRIFVSRTLKNSYLQNSAGKAGVCAEIMRKFGCTNIVYSIYMDYIPVGHKVTFEPSEEESKLIQMVYRFFHP